MFKNETFEELAPKTYEEMVKRKYFELGGTNTGLDVEEMVKIVEGYTGQKLPDPSTFS